MHQHWQVDKLLVLIPFTSIIPLTQIKLRLTEHLDCQRIDWTAWLFVMAQVLSTDVWLHLHKSVILSCSNSCYYL